MSAEELARIDWKNGMTATKIAEKHGISVNTVKSWIKRKWKQGAGCKKGAEGATPHPAPPSLEQELANAVEGNESLKPQQKDFCLYYAWNPNASRAYSKAYGCSYAAARANGSRLLKNDNILQEISELRKIKNAALGGLCGDDVLELHFRIAFADMTDYAEWKNVDRPVLHNGKPVEVVNPNTDKPAYLSYNTNVIKLQDSSMIDGQLVKKISQGRDGVTVELRDQNASMKFLERYFSLNPMDKHKQKYDQLRNELEERKVKQMEGGDDDDSDVRIEIVRKSGADDE